MAPLRIALVPTLCFHGIGMPDRQLEAGEERFWITELAFERILDTVAGHPGVQLTFDDGNASDVRIALPALLERGLAASFFVIGARMDQRGSLTRAQVRELHDAGMVVGSHGMDHVAWRELRTAEQKYREYVLASRVLEDVIGQPVQQAACPRGSYDRSVLRSLRRYGYERVYTVDGSASTAGAWVRDRYSVTRHDTPDTVAAYFKQPAGVMPAALTRLAKGFVKRWR